MSETKNIFKLSELSQERLKAVETCMGENGTFKRPNKKFNGYGLKFDIDYLNSIGSTPIVLPLEYMAEYSDMVTRGNIEEHDTEFINDFIDSSEQENDLSKINATAIGNCAYVALNCSKLSARQAAMKFLEKYFLYFQSQLINHVNKNHN